MGFINHLITGGPHLVVEVSVRKYNQKINPKNIPNSNNHMKKSTNVCRNDVWELFEKKRDKPLIDRPSVGKQKLCLDTCAWTPCLQICSWELCLETSSWNPCLATSSWNPCLETFSWESCLGTLLGNLLLGTFLGIFGNLLEPVAGNLAWEPLGTSSWEPLGTLGILFGNLGNLGNLAWEPSLGTVLGNLAWEPSLGTVLGNLAWEPCLGTLLGNPFLGTWELWQSGFWLLRPAPVETSSLRCWGKKYRRGLKDDWRMIEGSIWTLTHSHNDIPVSIPTMQQVMLQMPLSKPCYTWISKLS